MARVYGLTYHHFATAIMLYQEIMRLGLTGIACRPSRMGYILCIVYMVIEVGKGTANAAVFCLAPWVILLLSI